MVEPSPSDLRREIRDLQDRLSLRERHLEALESSFETSEDQILEWRTKYEILFEAHRKLQRTNSNLEDKLLRIVDKFESDKSQMTRDLASQTQKLVEAKLNLHQLRDQNADLSADLHLSITLLQNRPSSYVAQKVDNLPSEVRARLKRNRNGGGSYTEGKRITVSVDHREDDTVSAAILAKVLEERDKERRKSAKFCIDVGTQTHGWCFPDNKIYSNKSPLSCEKDTNNNNPSSDDIRVLRSSLSLEGECIEDRPRRILDLTPRQSSSSHILLAASVIQRPPSSSTKSPSYSSTSENSSVAPDEEFIESKLNSIRFGTYSVTETDL
ncbi:brain-enriched guanylate kinase-associated protein [Lepeophtheirus salmonis]|uniref:brain-enriched guanylate kinase-associated protein n=1 Tax=Lepeophtheirus salmonis TaxID=72036 RepID=UPI001AE23D93|nr:uncharacterized protein LOC121123983 [Lepeophtheirus salmonis]